MEKVTFLMDNVSGQVKGIIDNHHDGKEFGLLKKFSAFVRWFFRELYSIANAICDFAENIIVGNFAPKSIRLVCSSEYYRFQPFYHHLDKLKITKKYKIVLCNRFTHMPIWLKKLYCRYAPQLVCLNTNFHSVIHPKATGSFNCTKGGYNVNQWHDLRNTVNPGSVFFHETAHMLAWLMVRDGTLPMTFEENLTDIIQDDFNNVIFHIMKRDMCNEDIAQITIANYLKDNGRKAFCVSDVFGGLTSNKVCGRFAHDVENYWDKMDRKTVGCEAFAEITSMFACKDAEAVHFTGLYLTQTMFQYEKIMKGIC